MAWSPTEAGDFLWPPVLDPTTAASKKANKKGELNDIFHDLAVIKKEHSDIGNYPFPRKKSTANAARIWGKGAVDFFASANTKKLAGSLKIVAKRAETTAAKKVSSEAKAALKAIAKTANDYATSLDPKVTTPLINKVVQDLVEADKKQLLGRMGQLFKGYKDCAKRGHPEIDEAKRVLATWKTTAGANPAVEAPAVGGQIHKACRDMTQNINNLLQAKDYGANLMDFGLEQRDVDTLPKLKDTLTPIANSQGNPGAGKNLATMEKMVKLVAVQAKLFDQIAQRVPG